jgi:2',3'-cyclic-nucleotide 2'-phosphodiesterase (5'-nucleotidase family)
LKFLLYLLFVLLHHDGIEIESSLPKYKIQKNIDDVYELRNYPHFKTLVDTNSTQPDKTLVVLSGDFLSPSLLSGLDQGRGMVDCMNACGITHVCFGNHETDIPSHELKTRISVDSQFNWINTNMREIDDKLDVNTFPHEVIEVTKKLVDERVVTKRIGLLGLLTDDPSIYRPGAFAGAKIENVIETTEQYMKNVMNPLNLDLIIPMTHQRINEDKEFMNKFSSTFPIIIGGHDHEVYDETVEGSRVIKTGMDGDNTAIIDITWDDTVSTSSSTATAPDIKVNIIRTDTYPAHESLVQRVESHERILHELHSAKIFRFHDVLRRGRRWDKNNSEDDDDDDDDHDERLFSTCNNRLGFSNGTQIFATILRMGMRADCCLMNAGNVRGGNIYDPKEQEWFTWKDLKAEFPFLTGLTCVDLPGRVIEETINQSRINVRLNPPVASGAYIHCCDQIEFDEERRKLISIKEEPFDPDKLYLCALPTNWYVEKYNHIIYYY